MDHKCVFFVQESLVGFLHFLWIRYLQMLVCWAMSSPAKGDIAVL